MQMQDNHITKITDGNFSDGGRFFGVNGLTADYNVEAGLGGNTDAIETV